MMIRVLLDGGDGDHGAKGEDGRGARGSAMVVRKRVLFPCQFGHQHRVEARVVRTIITLIVS